MREIKFTILQTLKYNIQLKRIGTIITYKCNYCRNEPSHLKCSESSKCIPANRLTAV